MGLWKRFEFYSSSPSQSHAHTPSAHSFLFFGLRASKSQLTTFSGECFHIQPKSWFLWVLRVRAHSLQCSGSCFFSSQLSRNLSFGSLLRSLFSYNISFAFIITFSHSRFAFHIRLQDCGCLHLPRHKQNGPFKGIAWSAVGHWRDGRFSLYRFAKCEMENKEMRILKCGIKWSCLLPECERGILIDKTAASRLTDIRYSASASLAM